MSGDLQLPPFDPPPVLENPKYVLYQGDLHALPAKNVVKRFRTAGLQAFMKEIPSSPTTQPHSGGMFLYNVFVARSHYLCALIIWRLRGRTREDWRTMSRDQRKKIAVTALVDGALAGGDAWGPNLFQEEELAWLQFQLGMQADEFMQLLARARNSFIFIGKRDLRWGIWITIASLISGSVWGWLISFSLWPVWVFLLLGIVVGVYTLSYSLPRAFKIDTSSDDVRYFSGSQAQAHTMKRTTAKEPKPAKDKASPTPPPAATERYSNTSATPYPDLVYSLNRAKEYLNRGDAVSALSVLEKFARKDIRGVHTAHSEYYKLLKICRQTMGLDTRNADSQIEELKLDWVAALKKGEALLRSGRAEESIAYFKRSLNDNPGEAGTASAEDAARRGIKTAEAIHGKTFGTTDCS